VGIIIESCAGGFIPRFQCDACGEPIESHTQGVAVCTVPRRHEFRRVRHAHRRSRCLRLVEAYFRLAGDRPLCQDLFEHERMVGEATVSLTNPDEGDPPIRTSWPPVPVCGTAAVDYGIDPPKAADAEWWISELSGEQLGKWPQGDWREESEWAGDEDDTELW